MATDPESFDAYSLLSKPTLDLTDDEVALVVEDLRRRRASFLATGKPDKAVKAKSSSSPKAKATAEEKKANTALLLSQLKISVDNA